jgi:hypothetical protein
MRPRFGQRSCNSDNQLRIPQQSFRHYRRCGGCHLQIGVRGEAKTGIEGKKKKTASEGKPDKFQSLAELTVAPQEFSAKGGVVSRRIDGGVHT